MGGVKSWLGICSIYTLYLVIYTEKDLVNQTTVYPCLGSVPKVHDGVSLVRLFRLCVPCVVRWLWRWDDGMVHVVCPVSVWTGRRRCFLAPC